MNQECIGKFIAHCRKEKNLTQTELAEKLGVTDRSVSNWENGKCMPDLSLFKPLCEELGITINELLSGEKLTNEEYQQKFEQNIVSTIDYTNKKLINKNKYLGVILLIFGFLIILTAISIFPPKSSWSSIYSIFGCIISLVGFYKLIKKLSYLKRIILSFTFFIAVTLVLFILDYTNVITNKTAPRFSFNTITKDKTIMYQTPFCNVFRINKDSSNEYYIIDNNKKYNIDTVPKFPFNKDKSGINNIIKYENKYIGNNSNIGNLINNLPMNEFGYVFEIDSNNLGLNIYYHNTNWYIEDVYLKQSLIYNSVSIFSLIKNLEYINYNFSGFTYKVGRDKLETLYPNYNKIEKNNKVIKENFNKYVEIKISNYEFVEEVYKNIFE